MDVHVIDDEEGTSHRGVAYNGDAEPDDSGEANNGEHDEDGAAELHEPCVGMEFDLENAAKTFYDEYARHLGFSTKVAHFTRPKTDGATAARSLHFAGAAKSAAKTGQGVGVFPSGDGQAAAVVTGVVSQGVGVASSVGCQGGGVVQVRLGGEDTALAAAGAVLFGAGSIIMGLEYLGFVDGVAISIDAN
ncbi:protein FAR1-RELATED SEQUENCE [Salix suchowensis]|nr:protein FAR1-RELATED SEQUENCE [Salix suchowensis]